MCSTGHFPRQRSRKTKEEPRILTENSARQRTDTEYLNAFGKENLQYQSLSLVQSARIRGSAFRGSAVRGSAFDGPAFRGSAFCLYLTPTGTRDAIR
jgi:hypothetical protein